MFRNTVESSGYNAWVVVFALLLLVAMVIGVWLICGEVTPVQAHGGLDNPQFPLAACFVKVSDGTPRGWTWLNDGRCTFLPITQVLATGPLGP